MSEDSSNRPWSGAGAGIFHWLGHLRTAVAFDGSFADYARSEGLKPVIGTAMGKAGESSPDVLLHEAETALVESQYYD